MKSANEAQLAKLEAAIKDAEENLGDIEVREGYLAKADYLYKIGVPRFACLILLILVVKRVSLKKSYLCPV